jgi:hypothetical protein
MHLLFHGWCLRRFAALKAHPLVAYARGAFSAYHKFLGSGLTFDLIETRLVTHQYASPAEWIGDVRTYYSELSRELSADSTPWLICLMILQFFDDDIEAQAPPPPAPPRNLFEVWEDALEVVPASAADIEIPPAPPLPEDPAPPERPIPAMPGSCEISELHQRLSELIALRNPWDLAQLSRVVRTYGGTPGRPPGSFSLQLDSCSPALLAILQNFVDARLPLKECETASQTDDS